MKKILFWGGSKLTEMLINFLEPKKDFIIYDPTITQLNFRMQCAFFTKKEEFLKIIGDCDEFIIGIGGTNGYARFKIAEFLKSLSLRPISYISKDCRNYSKNEIGEGNIIFPHSILGNNCKIGSYNFIDFNAIANHDSIIKDGNFLGINSVIQGESRMGNYSSIYTNAVLGEHCEMTDHTILGANSFLKVKNTLPYKIYAGSPAKEIGLSEINYREDKILELKKIL